MPASDFCPTLALLDASHILERRGGLSLQPVVSRTAWLYKGPTLAAKSALFLQTGGKDKIKTKFQPIKTHIKGTLRKQKEDDPE